MRIEFALALNVFYESVINHQNLSEGDCEVGLTFALSFVAPSGIEPESRASETLILSIEL